MKIKCKVCPKVITGYTRKQVEYMMKQHMISRHPEYVDFNLNEAEEIPEHTETDYGSKAWMEDH